MAEAATKETFRLGWWGLGRFLLAVGLFVAAGALSTRARGFAAERFDLHPAAEFTVGPATFAALYLSAIYGVLRPLHRRFDKPAGETAAGPLARETRGSARWAGRVRWGLTESENETGA